MKDVGIKIDKILDEFAEYRANPKGAERGFGYEAARQALLELIDKEIIGADDSYNELCEYCSNWDDGRNELRDEQRAKLKNLGVE